ncbi:MAG: flagellar biosynthesis protein FlhB [Candidatus Omnitrophota bacterium]|jgi:flagellar biosynthetic protein FlhB|nr:MAG: flagellar biosynthesis protein FlhB [Candidatus Omnitrophota bacterium]
MAETESGQEKTEPATGRKRSRAREEGNVSKSQELNTAILLIAGVIAFYFYAEHFYGSVMEAIVYYLDHVGEIDISEEGVHAFLLEFGLRILTILAPFYIIFVVVAIVINLAQVGFMFTLKKLTPDLKKLNPIKGLAKFVSIRSQVELLKSIAKMFIIAPVMISSVYYSIPGMMGLVTEELKDFLIHLGYRALDVAVKALIIMLILAIIDYIYQRWQFERDLKMTKQEVKQESKDVQGDPQIKARIRSIQFEMARKRMMEEVPEAEVVVTNPTEYAIALKYESEDMPAPQVVAKGKHLLARRIKEIAVEHDIPIVENRVLAQSLYKLVEVGGYIPPEMYQAVAEVLAYVYRLNNRVSQMA